MRERGVLSSYNSDSWETSRRLNLEAAKAVKYGGVPEDEALKFVTFNPAKQLGIERPRGLAGGGQGCRLRSVVGPSALRRQHLSGDMDRRSSPVLARGGSHRARRRR